MSSVQTKSDEDKIVKRSRTLAPITPNAGVAKRYERTLRAIVKRFFREFRSRLADFVFRERHIIAFKATDSADSVSNFNANDIASEFIKNVDMSATASLHIALKKVGYKPEDVKGISRRSAEYNNLRLRLVAENVALISNITVEAENKIRKAVRASIERGKDMGDITRALMEIEGMTLRRAMRIARDQTNKAAEQLSILKLMTMGVTEGIWLHRSGPKVPRPTHLAMHGARFNLSQGLYDPNEGRYVIPSELINCGCTFTPILPDIDLTPPVTVKEPPFYPPTENPTGGPAPSEIERMSTSERIGQAMPHLEPIAHKVMATALRKAPKEIVDIVCKYGDKIDIAVDRTPEAKYDPFTNRLCLTLNSAPNVFSSARHELGHAIDHLLNGGIGTAMASYAYADAMVRDCQALFMDTARMRAARKLLQTPRFRQCPYISDIFSVITRNVLIGDYGHSNQYVNDAFKRVREVAADVFALLTIDDREGIEELLYFFPRTIKGLLLLYLGRSVL